MKARTLIVAATCFGISSTASAIVLGPSNLGIFGYEDMDCHEPYMPYRLDEFALRSLRFDVDQYVDCVNEYIEAGDNDIERIVEAQEEARHAADAFSARLESWIASQR